VKLLQDLDKLHRFDQEALLFMRIMFAGLLVIDEGWPTLQLFLSGGSEFPDPLHVGARVTMALMVFTELMCATMVTIGLFTRLLCIPIAFGFTVAVFIHHWPDPFKYKELPSLYWASFIVIAILGPGKYSLDHWFLGKQP